MDPTIVKASRKKVKKRRAPAPPNPFTGEVDEPPTPVCPEEEEEMEMEDSTVNICCNSYPSYSFKTVLDLSTIPICQ